MINAALDVQHNADLRPFNTLRVAARARYLVQLRDSDALAGVLADARFSGLPLLVLGEGSNVLLTRNFDGLVLRLLSQRIGKAKIDADSAFVTAEAGVRWDQLVTWSLAHGYCGIENLALIPGLCGAAPIQNIGAYGVELSDSLHDAVVFDRQARTTLTLSRSDCRFGYRDSLFKQQPDRYIVIGIRLRLSHVAALRLDYAGIREELDELHIAQPSAADVAVAVRRLRRRKLPQPAVLPNAGSFFKNPMVDAEVARQLQAAHPALPQWKTGDPGRVKLSAGWLIEQAGFKGYRDGDAGIAPGHALVLVNHGEASGQQLLALAHKVQAEVLQRYGVAIEPEPVVI
jgi:UDP-N-acetylmuramate dehydrogenase